MKVQGAVVFITGGASGLGAAVARQMHDRGASVCIADLDQETGQRVSATLPRSMFVRTNVTSEESVSAAVAECVQRFGRIDVAVLCAGISVGCKVVSRGRPHPLASFNKVQQINLIGSFNALRLIAAQMAKQTPRDSSGERGVIIQTASVAAFEGQIGQPAYSASKGGVVAMTLPIARELATHGIRCNTIAPGIFETPMLAKLPDKVRTALGNSVPYPSRLGRPDEFASLCEHICCNQMINGTVIRLDGAIRMAAM